MNSLISLMLLVFLGLSLFHLFRDKSLAFGIGGGTWNILSRIMSIIVFGVFAIKGNTFQTEFDLVNYALIYTLILASLLDLVLLDKSKKQG